MSLALTEDVRYRAAEILASKRGKPHDTSATFTALGEVNKTLEVLGAILQAIEESEKA
jgi:hypothetical protein